MTVIDIGYGADSDLGSTAPANYTRIDACNPANATGIIDIFYCWYRTAGAGVKAAIFSGSGVIYFARDVATIGNVTPGSKQTFSGLSLDVVINDYIGQFDTSGGLSYASSGGVGMYYLYGDQTDGGSDTYDYAASYVSAMYGTGTTGWSGKIYGMAPKKIYGIEPKKVWGV